MNTLKFTITPTTPATPFVSETLRGGKTFDIVFPQGKRSAIFVQQSADGTHWTSKQSVSLTPKARIDVSATDTTYLRVLVSERPATAQYENYETPGGGSGTVKSVNGIGPDQNGNVEITVGDATYATEAEIDALWQN